MHRAADKPKCCVACMTECKTLILRAMKGLRVLLHTLLTVKDNMVSIVSLKKRSMYVNVVFL